MLEYIYFYETNYEFGGFKNLYLHCMSFRQQKTEDISQATMLKKNENAYFQRPKNILHF